MYRVLFHHIDSFLKAYESRFERDYGYIELHKNPIWIQKGPSIYSLILDLSFLYH